MGCRAFQTSVGQRDDGFWRPTDDITGEHKCLCSKILFIATLLVAILRADRQHSMAHRVLRAVLKQSNSAVHSKPHAHTSAAIHL